MAYTHRNRLNKSRAAKQFNRQSRKTNRKNTKSGNLRGGIRT